jgi:hypothetical protein
VVYLVVHMLYLVVYLVVIICMDAHIPYPVWMLSYRTPSAPATPITYS